MTVVRLDEIESVNWQPKLGELGAVVVDVDDVNQCIRTVLSTPRGSCPHHPEFGSDVHKHIDAPISIAAPSMIRDAYEALAIWETRAAVESITPELLEAGVELVVNWRPAGTLAAALETRVRL